jgi:hypothetical protein
MIKHFNIDIMNSRISTILKILMPEKNQLKKLVNFQMLKVIINLPKNNPRAPPVSESSFTIVTNDKNYALIISKLR